MASYQVNTTRSIHNRTNLHLRKYTITPFSSSFGHVPGPAPGPSSGLLLGLSSHCWIFRHLKVLICTQTEALLLHLNRRI